MAQNHEAKNAQGKTFVALLNFEKQTKKDLSFKKGDKFLIINAKSEHWWKAKCLRTGSRGNIPSNYVKEEETKTFQSQKSEARTKATPPVAHNHSRKNSGPPPRPPKGAGLISSQDAEVRQSVQTGNVYEIPDNLGTTKNAMNIGLSNSASPQSPKIDEFGYSTFYVTPQQITPISSSCDAEVTSSTDDMEEKFHFGRITQELCDRLLYEKQNNNGVFLVRESINNPGQLCLSVLLETKNKRQVHHYRLKKNKEGYLYFKDNVLFKHLGDLVRHYSALEDGLCCKLQKPCPKPEDKKMLWATARESVKLEGKIGSGNFGTVEKGLLYEFIKVAVKTIKTKDMKSREDFMKEADLMKDLGHPNIVRLYGMVYDEPVWIITEFMSKGSLLSYLRLRHVPKILLPKQKAMCLQIASGMAYLEEMNYIHRDLRADNVLVSSDEICKIADFGLARILDDEIYESQSKMCPVKWTAPEALLHHLFSIKSDVWSYGIVLMEIFTDGGVPYPGIENKEIFPQIQHGYRMPKPDNCPPSIYNMMELCWEQETGNRPSFENLKEFFENFEA